MTPDDGEHWIEIVAKAASDCSWRRWSWDCGCGCRGAVWHPERSRAVREARAHAGPMVTEDEERCRWEL